MTNKGIDIKRAKERGEWAELRFMARAAEEGLVVTKPWGESSRYDFAVERSGRFLRVQVKSTLCRKNNSYPLNLHGAKAPYSIGDFDFVAAYVIPLDLWYIIPAEAAITGREKLYVTPGSPKTRYEQYREAWHLLFGKSNDGHVGTAALGRPAARPRSCPSQVVSSKRNDKGRAPKVGPFSISTTEQPWNSRTEQPWDSDNGRPWNSQNDNN